ncbi:hypothetical protein [Stackebrandtia nassauensis]|uniref:SnoaL-like domain-containing protein n=1 Tax=Stackebrandtia nassauensis (strain DSM 44728 / CIP 108903 / NRRL B-16338 / NBRC 102104 / LLR-40K-21) TaxID=446470 RepID=D3PX71_STANL|nr:hypothetical protein [Stackebrandtia nassauensis]ADD41334.1 hypothetical protein Snas_1631 [Stackebrandtia nassauensis DSM 44728]
MATTFLTADPSVTGYTPTDAELAEVRDWFQRYDTHGAKGEVEHMADMADFPINLVTDGSDGNAWTGSWNREEFLAATAQQVGDGSGDLTFESTRVPYFLTGSLVIVFTDSTMTAAGQTHRLRYADILTRKDGTWRFQTMIQGGWADMLTGAANA